MRKPLNFIVVALVMTLQGCGIPELIIKKEETTLPENFEAGLMDRVNSAQIKWQDFFEDANLIKLINIALVNNKEVNIMMQRISVAENEIQARKGEYLPFVKFGASADGDKVSSASRSGAVEEGLKIKDQAFPAFLGDFRFGLFSTWEIDIWKKLRNATQVAVLEYMASIEGKNFLITNLVAEIAHSYYELITLDNQLENIEQNIALQVNGLEMVKQLQQYGKTSMLAVKRYEAEVAKNQSKKYEISQQITVVENRINTLLGRTPQPIERTSKGFMEDVSPKFIKAGIPSQLLQNRPDIRKAELELSAAKLNIEVARANFYPSFGIKAGIGFDAFALKYLINTPESLAATIAGELVAPLVNKNAIIAEYKNSNAKQIQAAYEYEQSIINAYTEVSNQISNIDNLDKNYHLKKKQVDSLVESIEVANQLFLSARAEYLEVLLTQRDVLDAKKELIETKQKQINAMVDLYKSLGGGWL